MVRLEDVGMVRMNPKGEEVAILAGISFGARPGEITAIVGPSGGGKSTLVRLVNRLDEPTSGRIRLYGEDVSALDPLQLRRRVGMVLQKPFMFEGTVLVNLQRPFLYRNAPPPGAGSGEVLGALELARLSPELLERDARTLSLGQQQRVSLARALITGPQVLLLDEPTAGLDPMGEYRMMELLTRLNKEQGVTVVMATHSVDLVPIFLHQLHILSRGRLVRGGTPEEVFTAPGELANVKLRLPHIAELIYKLKHEEGLPFGRIPLTIGEARREIVETMGR